MSFVPKDSDQRAAAIDPAGSFIVQAPAGSGKTELLIQRYLALLGRVQRPDEILAITFTRKAAAEMRERIIKALESAKGPCPDQPHLRTTWGLAKKALQKDSELGWELMENPNNMQIQTIDSFCATLAGNTPLLSKFGGMPIIAEEPADLYCVAAERTISLLEEDALGSEELCLLLRYLDNQASTLRDLLVAMLGKRDQWLRHIVTMKRGSQQETLEDALGTLVEGKLEKAFQELGVATCQQVVSLGSYAASNLGAKEQQSARGIFADGVDSLAPSREEVEVWRGVADLLLTSTGTFRKKVDKRAGFPAAKKGDAAERKAEMLDLLESLEGRKELEKTLKQVRDLPDCRYDEEQLAVLHALTNLLMICAAQLWCVFQEQGQVDFIQVAQGAVEALGSGEDPTELLLKIDSRISHILVDEFQDTSIVQYELLTLLTSGWNVADGRTLFLVGDPMQSIYRFREAEVGLFLRSKEQGIGEVELTPLTLSSNFRSQAGVVSWVNEVFQNTFPAVEDETMGAIAYSSSVPVHSELPGPAVRLFPAVNRDDVAEASQVVDLIQAAQAEDPSGDVAILVRSRPHLKEVIKALHSEGIEFLAQEIDLLKERPLIQDILALTKALLHPADRVAWLAVLRAPWCGLSLEDMYVLCGNSENQIIPEILAAPENFLKISEDGRLRVERIAQVVARAEQVRGRIPLRQLVEKTWLSLGGAAYAPAAEIQNLDVVFSLLEKMDCGGDLESFEALEEKLGKLYALPAPLENARVQVMTIHKAKGLEFDTVIIPGLGRPPKTNDRQLLRWNELPSGELLLAPIPSFDAQKDDAIYKLVGLFEQEKQEYELDRLLYVAATRAKNRLYLLGHAKASSKGEIRPESNSLLSRIWSEVSCLYDAVPGQLDAGGVEEVVPSLSVPIRRLPVDWALPVI